MRNGIVPSPRCSRPRLPSTPGSAEPSTVRACFMIARQLLAAAACARIAVLVSAGSFDRVNQEAQPMSSATARLPVEGDLPAFNGAKEWINSPPLTGAALRGKVVLV